MPPQSTTLPLYNDAVPYSVGEEPADVPTLTYFFPAIPVGGAVIVCPGGGYGGLADHEGAPVARWLNSLGILAVVLKYRHAPRYRHPVPLADAQWAIRTLRARARAGELKIDPARIGILGSSAGGHLASTTATQFDAGNAAAADPVERVSSRPDLAILLYPVITLLKPFAHWGSRENLLGMEADDALAESLSSDRRVTPQTPPIFLFHTVDDEAVPVENSLAFAAALRAAGVPFEMHLYESGQHGVGLAPDNPFLRTWPTLCGNWLARQKFCAL